MQNSDPEQRMIWNEYPKVTPPKEDNYLTACTDKVFNKKRVQMMKWYIFQKKGRWTSNIKCNAKTITHWMVLPQLPACEETQDNT